MEQKRLLVGLAVVCLLIGSAYAVAKLLPASVDESKCIGCGACADICPVEAVTLVNDRARVDLNWCIGCGVCAVVCPSEAISITRRLEGHGPKDFATLHEQIKRERDL